MNKYDHKQLAKGDTAAYMRYRGWGGHVQNISVTTVERFTATQIVMADGSRFRRDSGEKVGGDGKLVDPKGTIAQAAAGKREADIFHYGIAKWEKERQRVSSLEAWGVCLAQLEKLVADAKRKLTEVEKGFE